jgi:hypothetical protein
MDGAPTTMIAEGFTLPPVRAETRLILFRHLIREMASTTGASALFLKKKEGRIYLQKTFSSIKCNVGRTGRRKIILTNALQPVTTDAAPTTFSSLGFPVETGQKQRSKDAIVQVCSTFLH